MSHPFSLRPLLLLLTILLTACLPVRSQEPEPAPEKDKRTLFRLLLLIIPQSRLVTRHGTCNGRMTAGDIERVSRVFQENFPHSVQRMTRDRVEIETEVKVSNRPLTRVSSAGGGNYWPSPDDVKFDLERYTRTGEYDGVVVYWMNWDGKQKKSLPGGLGYSAVGTFTHGVGYSVMVYQNPGYWKGGGTHTVFVHEWCHQLEAFYRSLGVRLPRQGLHGTHLYPGQGHNWYDRFLNGEVKEKDGTQTGLGEKAWRLGTMRERYLPEYLTPERKRHNLLRNGSFEEPFESAWAFGGTRGIPNPGGIVPGLSTEGRSSLVLQSPIPNQLSVYQDVRVKPRTLYLFSGWVTTQQVQTPHPRAGASLNIFPNGERSESAVGNTGWSYVKAIFDTGKRTLLRVGPILGGTRVAARGRAAFDDLCLIEIEQVDTEGAPVD